MVENSRDTLMLNRGLFLFRRKVIIALTLIKFARTWMTIPSVLIAPTTFPPSYLAFRGDFNLTTTLPNIPLRSLAFGKDVLIGRNFRHPRLHVYRPLRTRSTNLRHP